VTPVPIEYENGVIVAHAVSGIENGEMGISKPEHINAPGWALLDVPRQPATSACHRGGVPNRSDSGRGNGGNVIEPGTGIDELRICFRQKPDDFV
jgi:hypothetical protein